MKSRIPGLLVILTLIFSELGTQVVQAGRAEAAPGDSSIAIYVTPPITDEKILPTTAIPDSYISNEVTIVSSPGEYEPASFVIRALEQIGSLQVEATDLVGTGYSIPSSNVDIRVVKCWYQAGEPIEAWRGWQKILTPELLLKDDSLVRAQDGENYLKKSTDGQYQWISDPTKVADETRPRTIAEIPVQDSATLQPVSIPSGTNRQFWVTVKVPDAAPPGSYSAQIQLSVDGVVETLQLRLTVLPIELDEPYLTYSLYYLGKLYDVWPQGSISDMYKSPEQLRNELEDMLNHGVTNPSIGQGYYQPDTPYRTYLSLRNELGMGGQPLYVTGVYPSGYQPVDQVQRVIALARSYGVTDVYFYGVDEAQDQALLDQRASWQAIREAGGKMFVACSGNVFDLVGDLLDLAVFHGPPSSQEAAKWHSVGHQIFCYSNPQVGVENPEIYRRNFGLLLWQAGYDGAMDFAYQYQLGSIWNDFDNASFRDHVFAYPTLNGVIDTIQWEGFREGVDDVRYLTTLLNTIETARAQGKDTSAAETWIADLKSSDLTTQDLDAIRSQMIDYILNLSSDGSNQPPVLSPIGNKSVNEGQSLSFTVSATDPDGDTLTYSALNLPSGASFNPTTRTFSWTPNYAQAGTYPNVTFTVSDGSLTDQESITITVTQPYPDWDINGDGHTNVLDQIMIGQHWGETGQIGWRREDTNHDGTVNVLDMIIIGQHWTG